MSEKQIAVIGAGVVGLAVALNLQQSGHHVTVIDPNDVGTGVSFGNAGLFADYATLPFARFSMLKQLPQLLLDKNSPLTIAPRYLPHIMRYGKDYIRSCRHYEAGKKALMSLQQNHQAINADLFEQTGASDLVKANGCLGLFASVQALENAKQGDMAEREQCGVNLHYVNADEVAALEPNLAPFYAGGVLYEDTQFCIDPLALCVRFAECFQQQNGHFISDKVKVIEANKTTEVVLGLSDSRHTFDHVVVCAGVASMQLLNPLGYRFGLVSERGYHLMLNTTTHGLQRPVGWLDKSVFLTPMSSGIRLAGVAEFAQPNAPKNQALLNNLTQYAKTILPDATVQSTWVGSRPSTPDSLPVIGRLNRHHNLSVAFGHGHLGLTFAGVTGKIIRSLIDETPTLLDVAPFALERFN